MESEEVLDNKDDKANGFGENGKQGSDEESHEKEIDEEQDDPDNDGASQELGKDNDESGDDKNPPENPEEDSLEENLKNQQDVAEHGYGPVDIHDDKKNAENDESIENKTIEQDVGSNRVERRRTKCKKRNSGEKYKSNFF